MEISEFVLDCSVAIAWCFDDEATPRTDEIQDSFATGAAALIPSLWHLEISNVFLAAERRERITKADTVRFIALLSKLPITVDEDTSVRSFGEILMLGRSCSLSAYDSAYLELAIRKGLPLATNDKQLRAAAEGMGVKCI